jgi:hypothetical protein
MTSERGDHGNNEYNYIGIDLSDSFDGIKMNSMQQPLFSPPLFMWYKTL